MATNKQTKEEIKPEVTATETIVVDEVKKEVKEVKEEKKNTIEVDAKVLENLLERVESLTQTQKEYEQTASQDQIRKIEALRASGKLIKAIRVNTYDNKIIKSWQPTVDDVYIEPGTRKEISLQKTKLLFKDGEEVEIPQIDYARRKLQHEYEVISERKDKDGTLWYTVMLEGGEEFEIASPFVN